MLGQMRDNLSGQTRDMNSPPEICGFRWNVAVFRALCRTTQAQFADFQIPFAEHTSCSSGRLGHFAETQNCHPCGKNSSASAPKVKYWRERRKASPEEKENMNARPEIRRILLAKAMQRWALIGRNPTAFPNSSPSRARRNFSRLLAKYPELAQRLGLNIASAYPSV